MASLSKITETIRTLGILLNLVSSKNRSRFNWEIKRREEKEKEEKYMLNDSTTPFI